MATAIRLAPLAVLLLVIAIYHGGGLHFLYWPDSHGYLAQADSLFASGGYQRPGARSVGYPLLVGGVFSFSRSALALILAQALLVGIAYGLLWRYVSRAISDLAPHGGQASTRLRTGCALLLALTTTYSALQVFILSLLPEVLHAVLALVAVVAVSWLVLLPPTGRLWGPAALAAVAAGLPALVKPHWLLAAPLLAAVVAAKLAWSQIATEPRWSMRSALRAGLAALLPFAALAAVLAPDRQLAATDPRADLFGARTLFCNHLHHIADVLKARPARRLDPDPGRDARLKAAAAEVLATAGRPWRHLGFDGDHCMYNAAFVAAVRAELPDPAAERAFYMTGFRLAVLGDPLRFAGKVARQTLVGVEQSFAKFAYHLASPADPGFPAAFFVATSREGEAGPLRSKQRMKATLPGLLVFGFLGLFFVTLSVAFSGLLLLSLVLGPWQLRSWPAERRGHFMAYVGVPMLAVLGHHGLIGISHSFDIWRYAFGVFFISIGFVITAALFWRGELAQVWRLLWRRRTR